MTLAKQSRMRFPPNSLHRIAFFALAGVSEAHCYGSFIKGRWADVAVELGRGNETKLVTDFANWPDTPEFICKFTQKYGPLRQTRTLTQDSTGAPFEFTLEKWRKLQRVFQTEWRLYFETRDVPISSKAIATSPREVFVHRKLGLEYRVENLYRLLTFALDSIAVKRIRICARPDCSHPYFVARHLKQTHCSDECSWWGQQQWKNKWWREKGAEWREKRKK